MKKRIILIIVFLILVLGGIGSYFLYQYTELFGKKLIPLKIDHLEFQYIPGYDIGTGEQFNTEEQTVIDIQSISLKDSDLKEIKRKLKKIKKSTQKNDEMYTVQYKLIINKKMTIKIGDGVGDLQEGKKITTLTIPKELNNYLEKIAEKNNKKVLKNISSESVVVKLEGASITIKSKDNLKYINESFLYYPIHITEDYKKYDGGYKVSLFLDNNTQVYLYNEKIGFISQKDGENNLSTYGVFTEDLYHLIYEIYETSISK